VKVAWADHSRCDQVFGAWPATSLEEGLHRMANWVRSVGARKTSNFADIELTEGMPASWQDAIRR